MMTPTPEQTAILKAIRGLAAESEKATRRTIKVEAGAGTGKTTMLVMATEALRAENPRVRILYLAFNKEIQREAASKFGALADCKTIHGLAHAQLEIGRTKRPLRRLYRKHVKEVIGTQISDGDADVILKSIGTFCQSGDAWPTKLHVPGKTPDGRTVLSSQKDWYAEHTSTLFCAIAPDQDTALNLPFDAYLKYWQLLGAPGLRDYDIVLFDEGQDANPVMIAALEMAGNIIYVGDRHQQIYGFTGAVDAMSLSRGQSLPLTSSFRFGPVIADLANAILDGKSVPPEYALTGSEQIHSAIGTVTRTRPHARIFRTNMALIREAMVLSDRGTAFAIAGNNTEFVSLLKSVQGVYAGEPWRVYHPLVKSHKSWDTLRFVAHQDDDARDLTQAVKVAEEYGDRLDQVIKILEADASQASATVILTTAHRAKGREFTQVILMPDFDEVIERAEGKPSRLDPELNLLYVAATRAIEVLEIRSNYMTTQVLPKIR